MLLVSGTEHSLERVHSLLELKDNLQKPLQPTILVCSVEKYEKPGFASRFVPILPKALRNWIVCVRKSLSQNKIFIELVFKLFDKHEEVLPCMLKRASVTVT